MDPTFAVFLAIALVAAAVVCWFLNLVGLPGNWIVVGLAGLYAWLMPSEFQINITWGWLVVLLVLALLGEVVELVTGAAGAARLGGSWRGAGLALIGSFIGGILGFIVGMPLPIIGPLVASILGGSLGAMGGAVLGELWLGRSPHFGWQVGQAAFWGRLWGTLGKLFLGGLMIPIIILAILT